MTKKYAEERIKVPRFEEAAGFYTTKEKSRQMAGIKGGNTQPELRFRKALFNAGVRFRVNAKSLPGKPDISNKSKKFVVFVDGDFWHGHNWKERKNQIKSNRGFWIPKIERNMQRDREVNEQLHRMGYKVFRFWEREVKKELGACLNQVLTHIDEFSQYQ